MTRGACSILLLTLLVQLGAGCRSVPKKPVMRESWASDGNVSAQRVEAPASERYPSDEGFIYTNPRPDGSNAKPQYPANLLLSRLPPVSVTVRVVVDIHGVVTEAAVVDGDGIQPEFTTAVLSAVRGWRFTPLQRASGGKVEALPFSQQYRIVFSQINGRAVVESTGAAPK